MTTEGGAEIPVEDIESTEDELSSVSTPEKGSPEGLSQNGSEKVITETEGSTNTRPTQEIRDEIKNMVPAEEFFKRMVNESPENPDGFANDAGTPKPKHKRNLLKILGSGAGVLFSVLRFFGR